MTKREAAFNRKLQELIEGVERLDGAAVRRTLALLEMARKEVGSRIAATEWQAHAIPQLKNGIEQAISGFAMQYRDLLNSSEGNAWNAGIDLIDWPLHYAGFRIVAPEISRTALEILQGYSADLVTGLSADGIKAINSELVQGILGQKTPFEVMKAIGRDLDDPGVFKSLSARAEAITRTELARINSAAREARIAAIVEAYPEVDWRKKWISSGKLKPRLHHLALNGKTVPVRENFPGGFPYPHAPGLPASEVVHCGCTHVLTRSDWESMPKDWESELYNARAIWD